MAKRIRPEGRGELLRTHRILCAVLCGCDCVRVCVCVRLLKANPYAGRTGGGRCEQHIWSLIVCASPFRAGGLPVGRTRSVRCGRDAVLTTLYFNARRSHGSSVSMRQPPRPSRPSAAADEHDTIIWPLRTARGQQQQQQQHTFAVGAGALFVQRGARTHLRLQRIMSFAADDAGGYQIPFSPGRARVSLERVSARLHTRVHAFNGIRSR